MSYGPNYVNVFRMNDKLATMANRIYGVNAHR